MNVKGSLLPDRMRQMGAAAHSAVRSEPAEAKRGKNIMKSEHRWKYIGGAAFFLAVLIFLLVVFYALSHTNKRDYMLMDTIDRQNGWHYEILAGNQVQDYEPEFVDEYNLRFPEGTTAVRISRVLTEDVPFAHLEWSAWQVGVEVFLDGDLFYSDFRGNQRDDAGFLISAREELKQILKAWETDNLARIVRMSLPENYAGKTLSMTAYFLEKADYLSLPYPSLGNDDSRVSVQLTEETPLAAVLTIYAFFALATAAVFLMDLLNGRADWKILLLNLYFLLLFLNKAVNSPLGYYGILTEYIKQDYTNILYLAPLFWYLVLRLTQRWKIVLGFWTALWTLCEAVRTISIQKNAALVTERSCLGALLLFAAFAAAFGAEAFLRRKQAGKHRPDKKLWRIRMTVLVLLGAFNLANQLEFSEPYLRELLRLTLAGNFSAPVILIADTCAGMAVITLTAEVIRRTLRTTAEISVLQERSRQTLASYNQLLEADKAINSVRHEIRHHMTALSGILDDGDVERARRYIASVNSELDRLPIGRYSRNLLVNVIAGTYLNRAREEGIQITYSLDVPEKLPVADEDLSVFLNNMLQNALEACERMSEKQERHISLYMRLRANFLFVKCVNSTDNENEEPEERKKVAIPGSHGYGLAAMSRIAKKYDSMLVINQTPGLFEIKSSLCLKENPEPLQNTSDILSS